MQAQTLRDASDQRGHEHGEHNDEEQDVETLDGVTTDIFEAKTIAMIFEVSENFFALHSVLIELDDAFG